jgi:hypothetical protein
MLVQESQTDAEETWIHLCNRVTLAQKLVVAPFMSFYTMPAACTLHQAMGFCIQSCICTGNVFG